MVRIRRTGRDQPELWHRKTPISTGLYLYQTEGNQRSDDPFHRNLYEPAEEAPASFALFSAGSIRWFRTGGRRLVWPFPEKPICAVDTKHYSQYAAKSVEPCHFLPFSCNNNTEGKGGFNKGNSYITIRQLLKWVRKRQIIVIKSQKKYWQTGFVMVL